MSTSAGRWPGPAWRCALAGLAVSALLTGCQGAQERPVGVATQHLSGPGTTLPDDLTVLPGSSLIGAVFRYPDFGAPGWFAVLQVDGDPLALWRAYLSQFDSTLNRGLRVAENAGCQRKAPPFDRTYCNAQVIVSAGGSPAHVVALSLVSPDGDVTGRYLLTFYGLVADGLPGEVSAATPPQGAALQPTRPQDPGRRTRPDHTLPGGGGVPGGSYNLVSGTELLAKYGPAETDRGFDVVLHVQPGTSLRTVMQTYAGQVELFAPTGTYEQTWAGVTYLSLYPPGGGGAYGTAVFGVDQPGDDRDYVFYSVHYET